MLSIAKSGKAVYIEIMDRICKITCLLFFFTLLSQGIFSQEARTIPDALRRPERGEAARYPQDLVIGELGRGQAPDGAYWYAQDLLEALVKDNSNAPAMANTGTILTASMLEDIKSLEPRVYRLGGGRTEPDGTVSFLIRFVGSTESLTGELYIRLEETPVPVPNPPSPEPESPDQESTEQRAEAPQVPAVTRWILDDLILEEKRAITELRDGYRYDFSPYERFF